MLGKSIREAYFQIIIVRRDGPFMSDLCIVFSFVRSLGRTGERPERENERNEPIKRNERVKRTEPNERNDRTERRDDRSNERYKSFRGKIRTGQFERN